MKTVNIIARFIAPMIIACSMWSCVDLTETVYSKMTADKYYSTFSEADVPAAVATVYADMRLLYAGSSVHKNGCWHYTNEETADIWVTPKRGGVWYDAGVYYRLNKHQWLNDDEHILQNWRKPYTAINDCNRLLFQFKTAPIKDSLSMMSEIRTARAFWYFILCDMYGNVPIQTKYDVPKNYTPKNNTRQEVFDFVVKELENAIPNLSGKQYARWDKYAGTCLLAKTFLNAKSWGVEYDGDCWQKTIDLCDTIINSGLYTLESDFSTSFLVENEGSNEIIYAIANDDRYDANKPWRFHMCTMHNKYRFHANMKTTFWSGCCSTPEFAYSYDEDDLRYEKSWFEGQLYDNTGGFSGKPGTPFTCDPFDARDLGKPLCHTKDIPLFEGDDPETTGEASGVRMQKYEIKPGSIDMMSNDFVVFRYADVIFMKAEAMYWKNGGVATQEVCDLINQVRARAFTDFTDEKKVHVAELDDDRFLLEYGWEFCQEGWRRQQLIRFGQFTTKTWFLHDKPSRDAAKGANQDYRQIFPIPREEMLANPELVQNPGY